MKVNLRKVGAIVAGAAILASSAAFAGLLFGSTTLVDDNGAPVAKVVVGSHAQPSDGVAAALIAGKIVSETYKSQTLTAQVSGTAACSAGNATGTGTCAISNEKVQLEITVPGTTALGTWTGSNLIGDWLNRRLLDRKDNLAGDSDTEYATGTSDTSSNANPFTAGSTTGGSIGSDEHFLYQVDGSMFSPFADFTVSDGNSGNSYVEHQSLWLRGDNRYSTDTKDIIGKLNFMAYSLKFEGPGGKQIGIPECTKAVNLNYATCKDVGGNIDDATETHRVKVMFLGEQWIISEMNAPVMHNVTTENQIVSGGSVKLAKESVAGILNQGESLPVDNLKFQLDDLEAHGEVTSAIMSVLDANGNILKKDKVTPGETKDFNIGGKDYRFHVYKVAPGYTFGAKWADVAIFSKELELRDGQKLDQDNAKNEAYSVALGWKNLDADVGVEADMPDTLRTAIVFSDDIGALSSSTSEDLSAGDYVTIVQDPAMWKLSYKGLDLAAADKATLKFQIKTSNLDITAGHGPYTSCSAGTITGVYPTACTGGSPVKAKCTVYAPYVDVKSGDGSSVFETDRSDQGGTLTNKEFLVLLQGKPVAGGFLPAVCDADGNGVLQATIGTVAPYATVVLPLAPATDFVLSPGTVFMKSSGTSDDYGFLEYMDMPVAFGGFNTAGTVHKASYGTEVRYDKLADGDHEFAPQKGGAILIEDENVGNMIGLRTDVTTGCASGAANDKQLGNLLRSAGWTCGTYVSGTSPPDMYFATAEKAGEGTSTGFVDYYVFGVQSTGTGTPGEANFKFNTVGTNWVTAGTIKLTSDSKQVIYGHATSNVPTGTYAGDYYCAKVAGGQCTALGAVTGPVSPGLELVDEAYISERGSKFDSMDKSNVNFVMADKLAHAQWYMTSTSANASSSAASIVTLGQGESTVVNGVTVKVLDITETVGACSAAGGASACTADMSGVSAVIMPNNAATVSAALPTAFADYGNLVILDSDAAGVNTLISVGGDKVNTVTAGLLTGSPVDWTATPKVVKEVVQGSKIVVAGAEASDTLSAAADFVSQVKKV